MKKKPKVIIVGGGFAGCAAARQLGKQGYHVTLFDKRNHHVFQPLLYQVATAMLSPAQIAYPIRAIFHSFKNIRVLIGNITAVNKTEKYVKIKRSDQRFYYDYLIVAAGARHTYFGHPEWEKYAWGLKTTRDALNIRERMIYSFEKAERTSKASKRRLFSTFVIVGAGPTGVEMAGAIAELTKQSLVDDFTTFNSAESRIVLIEGSSRILNTYPEKLSQKAQEDLESMGVEIKLNAMVSNVTQSGVFVGDTFIESENVIWAAGNQASPLISALTEKRNRMGQAEVNPDFSIPESKNIFCVGDCASLVDIKNQLVPSVAPGAIQAGNFVAKQIIRDQKQKERQAFIYRDKGSMATIGRSKAIVDVAGLRFSGFLAWLTWCFVHILFLIDFRSKFLVFIDWLHAYLTHKRSVRLINMYRADSKTESSS